MNGSQLIITPGVKNAKGLREDNQDNQDAFASPYGAVYMVADGMGGHRGGAEASRIVKEMFRKVLESGYSPDVSVEELLQRATTATNEEIYRRGHGGDTSVEGMGSTVVLALVRLAVDAPELWVGHIGDSRAYLLRNGNLVRLTRDHSSAQRLVDNGVLTPEQAISHPDASVLTRAFGQQPEVSLEIRPKDRLQAEDIVLLCSDGMWGFVPDDRIRRELMAVRSPQETADALVELALRSGSDDNVTVQVLRASESPVTSRRGPRGNGRNAAVLARQHADVRNSMRDRGSWLTLACCLAAVLVGIALGFWGGNYYATHHGSKAGGSGQAVPNKQGSGASDKNSSLKGSTKKTTQDGAAVVQKPLKDANSAADQKGQTKGQKSKKGNDGAQDKNKPQPEGTVNSDQPDNKTLGKPNDTSTSNNDGKEQK